jgi:hypothetical protein
LVGEEERKKLAGYLPVAQYLLKLTTAGYKTVERLVTQEIAEGSIKL